MLSSWDHPTVFTCCPCGSSKTQAWRIWRITSSRLLNDNYSESPAWKLWEIVEQNASAHRLNLPRRPVRMIVSNLKWSPNVVEEKLARVYEVHAHLVEYDGVWWWCCMWGVAGFGGPSPFAGLAYYGRRLERSDHRPHTLHFDIMIAISCRRLWSHSGSVATHELYRSIYTSRAPKPRISFKLFGDN